MTRGQIFQEMMRRHGVKHIFGYPGGAILSGFDAIYNSKHFDFILPKYEQGAGHMAEGYARASGKPGIALVTSGPGATNVVTPMQDALCDGTPMIVFCGQVATSAIGSDAFQEADMLGISRSCTKWNVTVRHVSELPQRIKRRIPDCHERKTGPCPCGSSQRCHGWHTQEGDPHGIDLAQPPFDGTEPSGNYEVY
jgi:acetolactate synthase-1/2/3 large subunit